MTALVIAEHDNASIKGATLNTVAAAGERCADGVVGRTLQGAVVVFSDDEGCHVRSPWLHS